MIRRILSGRYLGFIIGLQIWINSINGGVTGKIAGTVRDASNNEVLPFTNVSVEAVWQNGVEIPLNKKLGAVTDIQGEFFIINLAPGLYTLKVTMMGYESTVRTKVKVSVDYTSRIDFRINPQALQMGEVVIESKSEMIKKDLTSSAVSVDASSIEMLPVNSINEILDLQAGMVRDAGGNLHIRGGRSSEITYMVDGVQVIDPLSRASGLNIDNQAVQELQAITGTFNAEYGQAMSGVINIVTKSGSDQFTIKIHTNLSDYLSFDNDIYSVMSNGDWAVSAAKTMTGMGMSYPFTEPPDRINKPYETKESYMDSYNPFNNRDFQINLSGPVPYTHKNLTYFISARYYYNNGIYYGKRYFMPWGFQSPAMDSVNTYPTADNKLVALGWDESFSSQSKIFYKLSGAINLSYGFYFNDQSNKGYSHTYKYVPDATKTYYTKSQTHIISLNHMLTKKTFYELKASYYKKDHENYLYQDPYDYRYIPTTSGQIEYYVYDKYHNDNIRYSPNSYDFAFMGNETDHGKNNVSHFSAKLDITSQINTRHQIKSGVEARFHDLENEWYDLRFSDTYRPMIMPISSPYHEYFHHKPQEFSAFVQEKAEFKEIIFNIGIRFDYFDPDANVLSDPSDPQIYNPFNPYRKYKNYSQTMPDSELIEYTIEERNQFWFEKVKAKYQISPRFGISFPITDRGAIHFSYGHFFQNPAFQYLYTNPEFEVSGAGTNQFIGNADLEAERTIMYEIGLQQAFSDQFKIEATGFYRDIRDWVGMSVPINTYNARTTYQKYINKDHASTQGVTMVFRYQNRNFFANMDYTYMKARGTTSNPLDAYYDLQNNKAPRVQLFFLEWDQTHTINTTMSYNFRDWMISCISKVNSGLPYTPTFARGEVSGSGTFTGLKENSERRPNTYNFDLRFSRTFRWKKFSCELTANIYNIFDTRNVRSVYSDTGQADYTLEGINQQSRFIEVSNVDEYYMQPGRFDNPRMIQIGLSLGM